MAKKLTKPSNDISPLRKLLKSSPSTVQDNTAIKASPLRQLSRANSLAVENKDTKYNARVTAQNKYIQEQGKEKENYAIVDKNADSVFYFNPQGKILAGEPVITGARGRYDKAFNYIHNIVKNTYDEGGETDQPKKPLYVSDLNDPRLKSYKDSLYLHALGNELNKVGKGLEKFMPINPGSKWDEVLQKSTKGNKGLLDNTNVKGVNPKIKAFMNHYQKNGNKGILPERYNGYVYDPEQGIIDMVTGKAGLQMLGLMDQGDTGATYKLPQWKKPNQPVAYKKPVVKKATINNFKTSVKNPVNKVSDVESVLTEQPVLDFSQVEKADGSVGMWGNPIDTLKVNPVLPKVLPMGNTDHRGVRSGHKYQGTPATIKAIELREQQLKAQSSRNYYAEGGSTGWLSKYEDGREVDLRSLMNADNLKAKSDATKVVTQRTMTAQQAAKIQAQKDAQELQRRKQAIGKSYIAKTQPLSAQSLADESGAIGDKFRAFPNDPNSFFDEYFNPGVTFGNMASSLGRLPLNIKEGNYGQAAMSIAAPLATGALAGIGTQNSAQFINNVVNPFAFNIKREINKYTPGHVAKGMKAVDEGNAWSKEWYSNPIIQERYKEFMHKPAVANVFKDKKRAMQNFKLALTMDGYGSINLDKSIADRSASALGYDNLETLLETGAFTKGSINKVDINPNTLARYSHTYNDALVDIVHPEFVGKNKNIASTAVHENTHAITMGDKGIKGENKLALTDAFSHSSNNYEKYLTKPTEIHARIAELRKHFGYTPEKIVDDVDISRMISAGKLGQTPVDPIFFNLVRDPRKLRDLFNTVPAIGVGVTAGSTMSSKSKQKNGGQVNWLENQILKIAGFKTEEEFYSKFPTEEAFMKVYGNEFKKAAMGGEMDDNPYLPDKYLATSAAPQVAVDSRANIWDNPNEIPTIESDVPTLSFEEQMKRRMEKDRAAIEDGRITPEEPKKKLGIKDFLAAGVERLQNNSDKFMGAYNDPISAINMLGYGANIAGMFENKREEKAQEKRNQTQYSSDYMYNTVPDTSGNRGDYSTTGTSYGQFRPDELGAKSPYGTTGSYLPAMKMGGKKKSCKYEEGGEYNLSQKEVLELIKNGAQIEFL